LVNGKGIALISIINKKISNNPMSRIVIDEIFDPIGNSYTHRQPPTVHWQYAGMDRKYGVQINWQSPQGEKSMHNTIDMHCSGIKEGKALWEIIKDNFYIDNKKPEDHITLLAVACAAPYYPFEFMTTKDGKVDSVINTDKLKKRFAEARPTLLQHYEGDVAIEYIEATEIFLQDQEQLKDIITKDTWLSLFFASIVGEYDYETRAKEITIRFPFFGFEEPLLFKGIATKGINIKNRYLITIEAALMLPAIIEDITIAGGKIGVTYDINIATSYIENIKCNTSITTEQGEYTMIINGYEIIKRPIAEKIKEVKPKPKPVGWMAFFK
jgi:hypothetical protein